MEDKYGFFVTGIPVPQGSKRHVGHGVMVEQGGQRLRSWREAVRNDSGAVALGRPLDGPLEVFIEFHMPRPKNHYRSGRFSNVLKPDAPRFHAKTPDIDKLIRSTLDGLKSGGVFFDDAQVSVIVARKIFTEAIPGAAITISRAEG